MIDATGTVRPGWSEIAAGLDGVGTAGLHRLQRQVERLLDDDGVTYTPVGGAGTMPPAGAPEQRGTPTPGPDPGDPLAPERWRLDPVPWVVDAAEWAGLSSALRQRATLLDLVLTDLYGPRTLIRRGLIPPELVFGSHAYLRRAHGLTVPGPHQLFLHAADVVRGPDGAFVAMGDRTEAPSGAGYAMADRRVIARVAPDVVRRSAPESLTPFFRSFLLALQAVAPRSAEDPRVVVLSPGTHSETAFDQAFLAGLLGLPLVESEDLTVREGRVWMRALGRHEPVDVILRRVDAAYVDPLELRPDSRLGVVGLLQAARRGSVSVVNTPGSGILENPGLLPLLPALADALLGEELRLPSAPTFWCGEPTGLSHVLASFDDMVLRPTDGVGRGRIVGRLNRAAAAELRNRVRAQPTRWVGQPFVPFSVAPVADGDGLRPGQVGMRLFAVAQQTGYLVMPGGLGRVLPLDQQTRAASTPTAAKDVWVRSASPAVAVDRTATPWAADRPATVGPSGAMTSPRALEDLFWFGRYTERTEDFARLLIATWDRLDEFRQRGTASETELTPVLLATVTHSSATYPGFTGRPAEVLPELRSLVLDGRRSGSIAQALRGLTEAASGVRDQLSRDTWLVLAGVERALATLRDDPHDQGSTLQNTHTAVLSGMLALSGLAAENMIRDPGWYVMDIGRRLERSLQLVTVLRWALARVAPPAVEVQLIESVLQSAESILTYRRRYRGRTAVGTVLELLLLDAGNPRSLAFQLQTLGADLRALPDASGTALPDRLLDDLVATVRRTDIADLDHADGQGERTGLVVFLEEIRGALTAIAAAVAAQRFRHPAPMRPLDRPWDLGVAGGAS
ncbi:circularly permuted type 2 ATP-grasp protein [Nakamurella deserti]|uniref:circularly permuted type 2 ATP-grasp protein n=1 Tax=Nakamurella deserti TaxID=2164074 RepID=UPI001300711F|nr:circularly permuted type 2 ATP-grasp protein [Nakamurella deserti]